MTLSDWRAELAGVYRCVYDDTMIPAVGFS